MKKLLDKVNVAPISADYPYGNLKNNTGTNDGTPVDLELVGDSMQLFERMMAQAGITPNGLPDNNANGFQLFLALTKLIDGDTTDWVPATLGSGYTGNLFYRRIRGVIHLRGSVSKADADFSTPATTLPDGFRPVANLQLMGLYFGGGSDDLILNIGTNGEITGSSAAVFTNLSVDTISFPRA